MKYRSVCRGGSALLLIGVINACDAQVDPGYEGEPLATLKGRVSALSSAPLEAEVGVLWLADPEGSCSGPEQSCSYSSSGSYSPSVLTECTDACGSMPECEELEGVEQWESCQHACGVDIEVSARLEYHACSAGGVGQTAPVVGDFPAQFSLDVLEPPPPEALLRSQTGERIALGWLVAIAPDSGSLTLSGLDREPPAWLLGGSETHVLVYAADPVLADSRWGTYLGGREYGVGYHLIRVVFGTRCGLPQLEDRSDLDDEDSEGSATLAPTSDAATTELPPVESESSSPSYAGVPLVCGNGVCDPGESCSSCSDCISCDGAGAGVSSGRSNVEGGYFCSWTPPTFEPSSVGGEAEIELLIAPAELIEWPSL